MKKRRKRRGGLKEDLMGRGQNEQEEENTSHGIIILVITTQRAVLNPAFELEARDSRNLHGLASAQTNWPGVSVFTSPQRPHRFLCL